MTEWSTVLAKRVGEMTHLGLASMGSPPGTISFAGGSPATELVPVEDFAHAYAETIREQGPTALQYGPTDGLSELREQVMRLMAMREIDVDYDDVLITNGALQGIDLVARTLLEPGDLVALDAPTFLGALPTLVAYGVRFAPVGIDEEGTRVDELASLLAAGLRPKLFYALPTFHNPAGVTMSDDRRAELLELSAKYGFPILEDDCYSDIWFESRPPKALVARSPGNVIYVSTFSKLLGPGLRLGWIVRPREVRRAFLVTKRAADAGTGHLLQWAVHRFLSRIDLARYGESLRGYYRVRAEALVAALQESFPPYVSWHRPKGGLFVWLELPAGTDSRELLERAIEAGVAFYPGPPFFADGSGREYLRLTFSKLALAEIQEGVRRLAAVVTTHVAERNLNDARG